MLTTKEAIEKRRSIRKFKPDAIPEEYINELLNAARLAPSGSNAQPWRFKIVKDEETKLKLAHAAHNQLFIGGIWMSPVTPTCCGLPCFGFRLGCGLPGLGLSQPSVEPTDRIAFPAIWTSCG